MFSSVTFSLTTHDPVDSVSRLLAIVQRCSIALDTLSVEPGLHPADDDFRVRCRLQSVPFSAGHLADRIRQMPYVRDVAFRAEEVLSPDTGHPLQPAA